MNTRAPISYALALTVALGAPALRAQQASIHEAARTGDLASVLARVGDLASAALRRLPPRGARNGRRDGAGLPPRAEEAGARRDRPQVPAGQLLLTDDPSSDEPDHKVAYRELLVADVDPPPLLAGRARESVRFFAKFGPGGSHQGRLTPAELKLVSEWVDLGAQYFNDPFAAPLD